VGVINMNKLSRHAHAHEINMNVSAIENIALARVRKLLRACHSRCLVGSKWNLFDCALLSFSRCGMRALLSRACGCATEVDSLGKRADGASRRARVQSDVYAIVLARAERRPVTPVSNAPPQPVSLERVHNPI
jgi:hypothetical protein